ATGKPWYQYVEDEFFKPLSMDRSITSVARLEDLGNFATPHKPIEGKSRPISWVNWDNMGAAGGIISSVKDMSQWIKLNLQNGLWQGDTLIHPMQQNILWTPHNNFVVSEKSKKDIPGRHFSSYGLGWGLYDYFGRMVVTHSGGYDGMYSRVMMMPDEKLGVVILTNSMSGITFPLAMKIVNDFIKEDRRDWSAEYLAKTSHDDRISQLKQARVNNTSPSIDEEDFTGTYRSDMLGEIKIVKNEDQLKLLFSNAPNLSATIMHWHYDTWQIHWDETHAWFDFGLLTVKTSNDLKVTELTLDVPNHDIFFDELTIIRQE
ncbi:MAG: serine hydrolase, partial [Cyclobacteriaceae bacterium]|nr:serine hydrolase [Cyclobacteriaceae bacterium HetDA_MAG_MS6]